METAVVLALARKAATGRLLPFASRARPRRSSRSGVGSIQEAVVQFATSNVASLANADGRRSEGVELLLVALLMFANRQH